ncbi:hypothetical protein [Plantactinospora sp. B5E13]|uniref:hypothetical protein n=1 Tax=unclassified Plantactinospora TaxID=2631981 RepID=UPI00325E9D65
MTLVTCEDPVPEPSGTHLTIRPRIWYFGTPVVLVSTENADGTANLAPISSAWALGSGAPTSFVSWSGVCSSWSATR